MCVLQAGLRPVCEFMTFNFSMQAIDQVQTIVFELSNSYNLCYIVASWIWRVDLVESGVNKFFLSNQTFLNLDILVSVRKKFVNNRIIVNLLHADDNIIIIDSTTVKFVVCFTEP